MAIAHYYACGYTHYHCGGVILDRAHIRAIEDKRPRSVAIHFTSECDPYLVRDAVAMADVLAWYQMPPATVSTMGPITLSLGAGRVPCPLCQRETALLHAITSSYDPREVYFCGCEACLRALQCSIGGTPHPSCVSSSVSSLLSHEEQGSARKGLVP
jgi:hypothetical protein